LEVFDDGNQTYSFNRVYYTEKKDFG